MIGDRRPYRVVFEEDHGEGVVRRGTVVARDFEQARSEARSIALAGKRAEVHYVSEEGERTRLAEYPSR